MQKLARILTTRTAELQAANGTIAALRAALNRMALSGPAPDPSHAVASTPTSSASQQTQTKCTGMWQGIEKESFATCESLSLPVRCACGPRQILNAVDYPLLLTVMIYFWSDIACNVETQWNRPSTLISGGSTASSFLDQRSMPCCDGMACTSA